MILTGNCLDILPTLPDASVQCCVTSPPYWGLRDYGVDGQLGLEATPDAYVQMMVQVFREVRRVLKDDGTLWVNLGDSYAGIGTTLGRNDAGRNFTGGGGNKVGTGNPGKQGTHSTVTGLRSKNLVGIPWRVAFALQADGWYLRSDIIWHKPNTMPESVQGSHFSRHRVTIEEYENLSGLPYEGERAGDEWAGDMPALSEIEIPGRQAPLSAQPQRQGHCTSTGRTKRCQGEATSIQPIKSRKTKQTTVRTDEEGEARAAASSEEISGQRTRESRNDGVLSQDEERATTHCALQGIEQPLYSFGEGESQEAPRLCETEGRDRTEQHTDGRGLDCGGSGAQTPLLLLSEEAGTDDRSCDSSEQGRKAFEGECRSGVPDVQFQEEGQDGSPLLAGCPGCKKCLRYHGYIFHLSAGRPTKSHEYLFLLTKSERYFYDAAAIYERAIYAEEARDDNGLNGHGGGESHKGQGSSTRKFRTDKQRGHGRRHDGFNDRWDQMTKQEQCSGLRNKRSVWTVATQPYAEAHFATFPPKLIEPCILAGSRPGDTVLDPFAGAGTTLLVAKELNRQYIGIELNPDYIKLIENRLSQGVLQL